MKLNLTKAVKHYHKTGLGLGPIKQQIFALAYSFPRTNSNCTEEDCADFLLSFSPRIDRILQRYKLRGIKFEAYLQSCFAWHMKTYLSGKILKHRREKIIYRQSCENWCSSDKTSWEVHEEAPGPLFLPPRRKKPKAEETRESLRIILLALKCADEVNDRFINKIALRLGTHSAVLFHLIEILRTTMRSRTERIKRLKEKQRESYFLIKYFMEMRKNCRDKFREAELDKKISREKRRFETTVRSLSLTPRGPSHGDIARILGVPKGTVDSGFFYIRMAEKHRGGIG
jgi:hypothetical protein